MNARPGASLAARLILLFALGSAVIMSAAGYALYHALGMQHEALERAEVDAKARIAEHMLDGMPDASALRATPGRLADIAAGRPDTRIGVLEGDRWVVAPEDATLAEAMRREARSGRESARAIAQGRAWIVRRLHHAWRDGSAADVLIATETTESRDVLRSHAVIAAWVAALGTVASALLAWLVVRRGLAPLAQLAQRANAVTAQHLGARLDAGEAPRELQGLTESINQMLERLEGSFATLEQFSADIAHELRTPLNNLLLQTQVTLSRARTAQEYQDALHSNLEELERLQRMVSEMLFLARADRGLIELRVEEVDLRSEVGSVVEYFEAAAAEKKQTLAVAGTAATRCDRSLARRAITNVLSNAIRYAPEGSAIAVGLVQDAAGASIAVTNPGPPISQPELRRLFTRFARRDESRARVGEGAGLGLAIVDSIMKLQGGRLEAASGDEGITFTLRFAGPILSKL